MSLNRVSNPAKLRKLSALVGRPVLRAYARFFADQRVLLVFTGATEAWCVNTRTGKVEPCVERVELVEHGVRTGI